MNNGDKIRSMNNNQLSIFLTELKSVCEICNYTEEECDCTCTCEYGVEKWLDREVYEND